MKTRFKHGDPVTYTRKEYGIKIDGYLFHERKQWFVLHNNKKFIGSRPSCMPANEGLLYSRKIEFPILNSGVTLIKRRAKPIKFYKPIFVKLSDDYTAVIRQGVVSVGCTLISEKIIRRVIAAIDKLKTHG